MDKNSNYKKNILNNSLETINPILAKEWHPTKNGDLKPNDVTLGSGKKVWWQCDKGHEWQATINSRNNGTKCPICSNKKILKGYNDLTTTNPKLAQQWHPTKNGHLKPTDITSGSKLKVWWQCEKGHEWQASIVNRKKGCNCPYCSNQKILKGYNDLQTLNPKLAKEWHPTKNGHLTSKDVFPNSKLKVWWQCDKGHEWQISIKSRNKGSNCPYCVNKKILKGYNDLQTHNPTLAKEWHPTKNGDLLPSDVAYGSNKKVWWQCDKGHEWETRIDSRNKGGNCPICSNQKLLKGYNDLATINPTLAKEWHLIKNGDLLPSDVTYGSIKKVWWQCDKGHEWQAFIFMRNKGSNCPICSSQRKTSFPEQVIYYYLNQIFKSTSNRKIINKKEADIFIEEFNLIIEYDGVYFHKNKIKSDIEKNKAFQDYHFIRIRENGLMPIDDYGCKNYILKNTSNSQLEEMVYFILDYIKQNFALTKQTLNQIKELEVNLNEDQVIIYNAFILKEKESSLSATNPTLAKEWHSTKNRNLKPSDVTYSSGKKVWWQCDKGHEWQATVTDRNKGSNCPYCSNRKILKGYNDLATTNPDLSKQWHPTKNGDLTPSDITCGSNRKVWWQCEKGHEWQATVVSRNNGNNCPICSNKKILKGYNDLETINPDLAKQWNPTKNRNLKPSDVTYSSGKKVWWQCNKGHEWQAIILSRTKGCNCPYCSGRNSIKGYNDLKTKNPTLAKQWHFTKNGTLTPSDVTYSSGKKVWWQCDKGHKWQATVADRNNGSNCPYCGNKKILKGYNDLVTTNPKLAQQWHPTKNADLTPSDVSYGSGKKVWWQCDKGHEWQATVADRNNGNNCPTCSNKKILKGYNDLATTNPTLAKEWHLIKNGDLLPSDVTCGSNKKVWWQCEKGHEWQAIINNRNNGNNCPYCSNKKILKGYNDLPTTNLTFAKQWHPTKNGDLKPTDITSGSRLKVWWQCKKGHEWQATVASRNKGTNCPHCFKNKKANKNNLS